VNASKKTSKWTFADNKTSKWTFAGNKTSERTLAIDQRVKKPRPGIRKVQLMLTVYKTLPAGDAGSRR
jgi:hypothetical protein